MPDGNHIDGASSSPKVPIEAPKGAKERTVSSAAGTLKSGEIVRGTMIDSPRYGRPTRVMLPRGTVLADSVPSTLRAGDVLQFRVTREGTSLQLQVDSVPIASEGRALASSEVLRILGMHESPAMLDFVDVLKAKHSSMTRAMVTEIVEAAAKLPTQVVEGLSRKDIAEVLHTLKQAGLPAESKYFLPMRRYILSEESVATNLSEIARQTKRPNLLSEFLRSANGLLDAFFPASDNSARGAVYKALQQAVELGSPAVADLAMRTTEFLEGQFLHNVLVAGGGAWSIAVPIAGTYIDAKLHVLKTDQGTSAFRVETETTALGEVTAGGSLVGRRINISFTVENEQTAELIEANRMELKAQLEEQGYVVVGIHTHRTTTDTDRTTHSTPSGINIVV